MSKIFGLAPFCYRNEKSERRIQVSIAGTIHTCLMCSMLMVLLVVLCKWNLENDFPKYSLIIETVRISDSIFSSLVVIVSYILCATINRRRVDKLFSLVSRVDTCLIKTVNSYRAACVSLTVGIVFFFLTHSFCFIMCIFSYQVKKYSTNFIHFLFHVLGMTIYFQFVYAVLLLKHRFTTLNEDLLTVFDTDEHILDESQLLQPTSQKTSEDQLQDQPSCQRSLHQVTVFELPKYLDTKRRNLEQTNELPNTEDWNRSLKVTTLRGLHSTLCDASDLTNSIFQVQMLMGFIEIFVEITLCLHACLTYVTELLTCQLYDSSRWNLLSLLLTWAAVNLSKLVAVTVSCHGASKQANHTAVLVHKLLVVQSAYPEITAELQHFSQQLLHRKLRFSACGFFSIDFTLLYSMAGSVTTYLVILLQYTGEDMGNLIELCNKTV